MKKAIVLIVLLSVGIAFFVFKNVNIDLAGLVILANTDLKSCETYIKKLHPEVLFSDLQFQKTDLDANTYDDYIVKIDTEATCGTTGCIHELCIGNQNSTSTNSIFGYSAHSVAARDVMNNGMKDIELNEKIGPVILTWSGTEYTPAGW